MPREITTKRLIQKRWADVTKHDLIDIDGQQYTLQKSVTKDKGKLKVTIRDMRNGKEFSAKVVAKHGVDVVELTTRKAKSWTKPDDQDEANLVEGLGATILGVRPTAQEQYIAPPVGIDTVAAHLYIFHAIDPAGIDQSEWMAAHTADHEAKKSSDLFEPHTHEANRPTITIGPRFQ